MKGGLKEDFKGGREGSRGLQEGFEEGSQATFANEGGCAAPQTPPHSALEGESQMKALQKVKALKQIKLSHTQETTRINVFFIHKKAKATRNRFRGSKAKKHFLLVKPFKQIK